MPWTAWRRRAYVAQRLAETLTNGSLAPKCTYMSYIGDGMKTVSARQANHEFSDLLSRVERGEEILITKRSKPVAVLSPYRPPLILLSAKRPSSMQSM